MPKVRFRDFYNDPESFEDLSEEGSEQDSTHRTQPFFRNKKHRKKDRRVRERNSRQFREDEL